jgi:hypothetical protein
MEEKRMGKWSLPFNKNGSGSMSHSRLICLQLAVAKSTCIMTISQRFLLAAALVPVVWGKLASLGSPLGFQLAVIREISIAK